MYAGIGRMYQGTQVFLYMCARALCLAQLCTGLDSGFSWNGPYAVCGRSRIHNVQFPAGKQSQLMEIIFNDESKGILTVPARNAPCIMQQCSAHTVTRYARRLIFIQNAIEPSICVLLHIRKLNRDGRVARQCGGLRWWYVYHFLHSPHIYLHSGLSSPFKHKHQTHIRNITPCLRSSNTCYVHVGMVEWLLWALLLLYNCTYVHTHCGMRDDVYVILVLVQSA